MYVRNLMFAAVTALLACDLKPCAHAADNHPVSGTLHASGTNEITVPPQKVRLALVVRAEGVDAKSAIAALVKHKERVHKELLEMKANDSSITFSGPNLSHGIPGMPSEWTAYQTRIFLQGAGSNGAKDAARVPQVYMATANVSAEWPLPTGDLDALAILPETLKEQLEARDLVGRKNKAALEPAKQEVLEELQAKMRENYAASTDDSEQYTVAFVGKVDDKTHEEAIKAAYDRAVAQAARLARTSGSELGQLVSARCEESPGNDLQVSVPTQAAAMSGVVAGPKVTASDVESAVSSQPGELKFTIKVDVEFAFAK